MILGPLEARFQRAFNTPNSIDFLPLKPEKIAREVYVQKKGSTILLKKIQVYILVPRGNRSPEAARPL